MTKLPHATAASIAACLLLLACGGEAPSGGGDDAPSERDEAPARPAPRTPEPPREARWLRAVLAYDLRATPTDTRTTVLGRRLGAEVACPQPGTGCFVELALAGQATQLHVGDDQTIQIWGPTEPALMADWVRAVEAVIDESDLEAVNAPGDRPDRLWRDDSHVVLLHDHTGLECTEFCPAMIWVAPPDHPSAAGYGF